MVHDCIVHWHTAGRVIISLRTFHHRVRRIQLQTFSMILDSGHWTSRPSDHRTSRPIAFPFLIEDAVCF